MTLDKFSGSQFGDLGLWSWVELMDTFSEYYLKNFLFYLRNFLVALCLRGCLQVFSLVVESRSYFLVVVCGLLIVVVFLVADHGLSAHRLQYLQH